ncbi:MAG: hypothetical protein ABR574_04245 [Cryomorphaceae bacterium]|nr:hypothetical protein [Flavobacteriales bacterium]
MKFNLSSLLVLSLLFLFTSCSDDDDSNNSSPTETGGHGGSASFTVSGELEKEHTGIADFRAFEMSGIHTWDINILDQNPITFNLSFAQTGGEPIDAPGVGTYQLGISQDDDIYLTSYSHYEDSPFQGEDYIVGIDGTSGALEINTSTDDLIEGTFSFTAVRLDDEGQVAGNITVSDGEFSAVPRP